MSREVDERIVEMQFDNRQFESGVAKTLNSLDRLTDALKFEGIGGSIRSIQNGINQMDFTPITNGVGALESTLTSLGGRIKLEVFDRLSKYAVDTGEKIFKALTTQGAKAGFAEYETQQGAVQTILANTQHLGTTVTDVNAALDDLNEYADLTIYNFTEMTRNIGTFTAAGLDLQTSTSAIKGIANLAAVSGSTSEQASRAMYQLSQALAAGRVNLMDWNSVVNAGMGGKVFQDALKRTAKHMGIVVDESKSFRESISGGDTWLSAEVLSETLKQLSGDMDEQTLAAQGWSQAEIEEITKMAKTATDAATVVKTFSQLTSTVSEQIGSGWTKTWQLIFGDFEESKALWTGVYKAISPYIDAISDLRNSYLQFWKENEGREKIIEAFSNLWSGASDFIDRFTASFRRAFPIVDTFGQTLTDISDRFLKFSERFKVVKDKTEQVTEAFENVSDAIGKITAEDKKNALDIWNWGNINGNPGRIDGQDRVEALGESYDRVQKYINTFIATGYDVAKTDELLGVGAETANKAISKTSDISYQAATAEEKRDIILNNLVKTLRNLADVAKIIGGSVLKTVKAAGSAFKDVFDPLMATGDLEKSTSVLTKIARAFEITAEKAEDVKRIFRGVFAAFDIAYQLIRAVAGAISKALLPSLGSVDKASGGLLKVLGNFGDWVYALDQAIKEGDLFSVAIDKMISFITSLDDKIIDVVHSFEKWSGIDFGKVVSKITGAISKGLSKFKDWTGIDIAAIFKAVWERIQTFIGYLKEGDYKGAFDYVVNGLKNFVTAIINVFKGLSISDVLGKAGEMFGGIGQWFKDLYNKAFGSVESTAESATGDAKKSFSLLDILSGIVYGIYTAIKTAIEFLYGVFTSPTAKELGNAVKDFFSSLFTKPAEEAEEEKSGMEKFKDFMSGLGDALADFYERIKPIVSAGFSGAFLKSLLDIAAAAKNFSEAPKNFSNALYEFADGFDKMQKSFKISTMSWFVTTLSNAILKLVIAIAAIMVLNRMEGGVSGAVGVLTLMLGEIIAALTWAQKKLDSKINMVFIIKMINAIANTMLRLSVSLWIISKVGDAGDIGGAIYAFSNIMLELAGMLWVMSKIVASKQFRRGGEGLMMLVALMDQLGKTVIVMSIALRILAKIPSDAMGTALQGLFGIFSLLALLLVLVAELAKNLGEGKKDELAAMSGTFMAIASAFLTIAPAIALLSLIPMENMQTALLAVAGIGALLAGMMVAVEAFSKGATNSKAIAAAGAAIVGVAFAINLIVPALALLGVMDPSSMWSAVGAIEAILAGITLVLYTLSSMGGGNVALAGVGILALASAFALAVPPMLAFAKFAIPLLEKAFGVLKKQSGGTIAKIIGAIFGMSIAMTVASVAVAALGIALLPLSISLALLILPITSLIKAIAMLAPLVAIIAAAGSEIGATLATAITKFISTLARGADEIAQAIKGAAPHIAEATLAVLDAILTATIGRIPVIAESLLSTLDQVLDAFIKHGPAILVKLGFVIDLIFAWVGYNIEDWTKKLVGILVKFLTGVIYGVADHLPDILAAVAYFLGRLIFGIFNMFQYFVEGIFPGFIKYMEKKGGDAIEAFVENWKTGIQAIKDFFTKDIPAAASEAWDTFKQVGSDIVNSILEGMKSANPFQETGEKFGEALYDFFNGELEIESPSKKFTKSGKYIVQGLEKGIEKETPNLNKTVSKTANGSLNTWKDEWGTHSESDETYAMSKELIDGGVSGLEDYGPGLTDTMGSTANDALNAFGDKFGQVGDVVDMNLADLDKPRTVETKIDIIPDVSIDQGNIEKQLSDFGYKSFLSTKTFKMESEPLDFSQFTATSTALSDRNAELETQRHADVEQNNLKIQALNDTISKLTESFENGIINIPDNATFTVPVTVDGETIANVTAPYLDVINGEKMNLERSGVTSR